MKHYMLLKRRILALALVAAMVMTGLPEATMKANAQEEVVEAESESAESEAGLEPDDAIDANYQTDPQVVPAEDVNEFEEEIIITEENQSQPNIEEIEISQDDEEVTEEIIVEEVNETIDTGEEETTEMESDVDSLGKVEGFSSISWENGVFKFKADKTSGYIVLWLIDAENEKPIETTYWTLNQNSGKYDNIWDKNDVLSDEYEPGSTHKVYVKYLYTATFDDTKWEQYKSQAESSEPYEFTMASVKLPTPTNFHWAGKSIIWSPIDVSSLYFNYQYCVDITTKDGDAREDGNGFSGTVYNTNLDMSHDMSYYGEEYIYTASVRAVTTDVRKYLSSDDTVGIAYNPTNPAGSYQIYDITSGRTPIEGCQNVKWSVIQTYLDEHDLSTKDIEIESDIYDSSDPVTSFPIGMRSLTMSSVTGVSINVDFAEVELGCDLTLKCGLYSSKDKSRADIDLKGHDLCIDKYGFIGYGSTLTDTGVEKRGTVTLKESSTSQFCYIPGIIEGVDNLVIDTGDKYGFPYVLDGVKNLTVKSGKLFCSIYDSSRNLYKWNIENLILQPEGELALYIPPNATKCSYSINITGSIQGQLNISRITDTDNDYCSYTQPFDNGFKIIKYSGSTDNIRYTPGSALLDTNPDACFTTYDGYVVGVDKAAVKELFEGITVMPQDIELEATYDGAGHYIIESADYDTTDGILGKVQLSKEYFEVAGEKLYPKLKAASGEGYSAWDNDLCTVKVLSGNDLAKEISVKFDGDRLGTVTVGIGLDYTVNAEGDYVLNCVKKSGEDFVDATVTLGKNEVDKDGIEKIQPLKISLKGKYTAADKEALLDALKFDRSGDGNAEEKEHIIGYLIGTGNNKLSDCVLKNDGVVTGSGTFTWVNPEQTLAADANRDGYYCTLKFTPSSTGKYAEYEPFTCMGFVAVTRITGLFLDCEDGKNVLDSEITGDVVTVNANYSVVGYVDYEDTPFATAITNYAKKDSAISCEWKDVTAKGYVDVTPDAYNPMRAIIKIKSGASFKDGTAEKIQATLTDNKSTKPYTSSIAITLVKGSITKITLAEAKDGEAKINTFINKAKAPVLEYNEEYYVLSVNSSDVQENVDTNKKVVAASITLNAKAFVGDAENSTTKLNWSSSDTGIVNVKAADTLGRSAVVTFNNKSSGDAVIYVKSADKGGCIAQILVYGEDHSPVQPDNKIILNANYNNTVERAVTIPLKAQAGTSIVGVSVADSTKYGTYSITKDGSEWKINAPAQAPDKKFTDKSFKLKVRVKDSDTGEEENYDLIYVLTVNIDKPAATAKQTVKPNVFYTDTCATYSVTSKYVIDSIKVVSVNGVLPDAQCDKLTSADGKTVTVTIKDNSMLAAKTKFHFEISYAGFTDDFKTVTKDAAAGITNKKPSATLVQVDVPTGVNTATTKVLIDKREIRLELEDTIEAVTGSKVAVAANAEGCVNITNETGKTQTYKANVKLSNWSSAVAASGKFNVIKQSELILGYPKITLNSTENYQDNGCVAIPVSLKNSTTEITGITYDKSNTKNASILGNDVLKIAYNKSEQSLKLGFNKSSESYANLTNGTYSIPFTAKTRYGDSKAAILKLTVENKALSVSITTKGNLNTVDRDNGPSLSYKITGSSTGVYVTDVKLTNPDNAASGPADYFYVKKTLPANSSVYVPTSIVADWDASLDIKQTYKMGAEVTLSNGRTVTLDGNTKGQIISIKPVQKLPKVTSSLKGCSFYKKSPEAVSVGITPAYGTIENAFRQAGDKNYSDISITFTPATSTDAAKVTLTPSDKIKNTKAGKYTVTVKYTLRGQAVNTAPQTLKINTTLYDIKLLTREQLLGF